MKNKSLIYIYIEREREGGGYWVRHDPSMIDEHDPSYYRSY
jgi:hypothetical protein